MVKAGNALRDATLAAMFREELQETAPRSPAQFFRDVDGEIAVCFERRFVVLPGGCSGQHVSSSHSREANGSDDVSGVVGGGIKIDYGRDSP